MPISKPNEDAALEHVRNRDEECARRSVIGAAACYGAAGATPNEQMQFVWNVAVRYAALTQPKAATEETR